MLLAQLRPMRQYGIVSPDPDLVHTEYGMWNAEPYACINKLHTCHNPRGPRCREGGAWTCPRLTQGDLKCPDIRARIRVRASSRLLAP